MESIAVFKVQQIRMLDSKPIEDTYVRVRKGYYNT